MNSLNIPVELCYYVVRKKLTRPFQVYLFLKFFYEPKVKLMKNDREVMAASLKLKSERAVSNNLKKLIQIKWIGHDKESGIYFVRGLDTVRILYGFKTRSAVKIYRKEILNLKEVLLCIIISHLINHQRRRKVMVPRRGGTRQVTSIRSDGYFPIANKALAKLLNISNSTASLYKRQALRSKLLDRKRKYKPLNLPAELLESYKERYSYKANKIKLINGKLYEQLPDLFKSRMIFTKRKKIDPCRGGRGGECAEGRVGKKAPRA